jgi:hypothetical protein
VTLCLAPGQFYDRGVKVTMFCGLEAGHGPAHESLGRSWPREDRGVVEVIRGAEELDAWLRSLSPWANGADGGEEGPECG